MNALARQYHSDDHKGHWQDGLPQSSRIIRSINKTLELVREAYMVDMYAQALIDIILEHCITTDPGRIAPFSACTIYYKGDDVNRGKYRSM